MNVFPLLIARSMLQYGCRLSIAEQVQQAITDRPEIEAQILWMKLRGDSYSQIAEAIGLNKGSVWRLVNSQIKNTVYSVLLSAS